MTSKSPPLFPVNRHQLGFVPVTATASSDRTSSSLTVTSMLNVDRHFCGCAPSDHRPPPSSSMRCISSGSSPPEAPKTYASAVGKPDDAKVYKSNEMSQVDIGKLSIPCVKGQEIVITLTEDVYQQSLSDCRSNVLGRIMIASKTQTPINEIYNQMKKAFKPAEGWRMVPLGKGYFDLHFASVVEKERIQARCVWTLPCGSIRILPWQPDFNPATPKTTRAQVWIRISHIGQEYWHPHLIMEIAHGVGNPLQLDVSTRYRRFGHYARVLVDVDMAADLPTNLWIERRGHGFRVDITYEKLPHFCAHCKSIGHLVADCRSYIGKEAIITHNMKGQTGGKTLLQRHREAHPPQSTSSDGDSSDGDSSAGDSSDDPSVKETAPRKETNEEVSSISPAAVDDRALNHSVVSVQQQVDSTDSERQSVHKVNDQLAAVEISNHREEQALVTLSAPIHIARPTPAAQAITNASSINGENVTPNIQQVPINKLASKECLMVLKSLGTSDANLGTEEADTEDDPDSLHGADLLNLQEDPLEEDEFTRVISKRTKKKASAELRKVAKRALSKRARSKPLKLR